MKVKFLILAFILFSSCASKKVATKTKIDDQTKIEVLKKADSISIANDSISNNIEFTTVDTSQYCVVTLNDIISYRADGSISKVDHSKTIKISKNGYESVLNISKDSVGKSVDIVATKDTASIQTQTKVDQKTEENKKPSMNIPVGVIFILWFLFLMLLFIIYKRIER